VDSALERLQQAHEAEDKDADELRSAIDQLNDAWRAASEHLYASSSETGGAEGDGDVKDADYEVVPNGQEPAGSESK
jgi:hypothetical protein